MKLRQRLENLPVGHKLLAALLVFLAAILLLANLAFITAAYWITQQSFAPQSMSIIGRLIASDELSEKALESSESASLILQRLEDYTPLRAAAIYDRDGKLLAELQRGDKFELPVRLDEVENWREYEFRTSRLIELPQNDSRSGQLLLVASSELPAVFFTGLLSASLAILIFSILLWMILMRQIKRLITQPIHRLEQLTRQVTREENYALRAEPGHQDEIGRLSDAFNTMLERIQTREQELQNAHNETRLAFQQAQQKAEETRLSNRQLKAEVKVRSKIEKKLTGFQRYLNGIIDSMPSVLIALDEDLYVSQWNQQASVLSGTVLEDALDQPIAIAFPPLKLYLAQIKSAVEQHKVERIEHVTWPQNREMRDFSLTFYPLTGNAGRGVVIRIDDITDHLNLREMMVQSEKMRSVGGLAAGMAHEINNPLGAILHNVQNIRRRLSAELPKNLEQASVLDVDLHKINQYLRAREIPQLLEGIQSAGSRAARIVSHMLTFSRRSDRQLTEWQLPDLIDQAVEIAGNDFDLTEQFDFKGLEIVREFDPSLGPVPVIANELEQVLINLLKNAAQAIHMRGQKDFAGRITLRTRRHHGWAEIQVEDNGIGMPEQVRKRIFEPFYTTKEVGQGTGLGLSVSYFIITNNHKGRMEVQSTEGRGSCFCVRLPLPA